MSLAMGSSLHLPGTLAGTNLPCPNPFQPPACSPSSELCCGVAVSSWFASLAMERVMRPLRRPWLLAVLRPLEATASFSSLSSPEVSSVFSLWSQKGHQDGSSGAGHPETTGGDLWGAPSELEREQSCCRPKGCYGQADPCGSVLASKGGRSPSRCGGKGRCDVI